MKRFIQEDVSFVITVVDEKRIARAVLTAATGTKSAMYMFVSTGAPPISARSVCSKRFRSWRLCAQAAI